MNPNPSDQQNETETLHSWKEIATYIQRNEATARRWEREEGLPVHRHSHKIRSSVFAYPSEIDAWMQTRRLAPEPAVAPGRVWWRPLIAGVTTLLCLVMVGNGIRPKVALAQQSAPTTRQLWTVLGGGPNSMISPDGRFVTYLSGQNLMLHNLVTGSDQELVHNEDRHQSTDRAVFSPDGKQIVYNWYHGQTAELRVMPAGGGESRSLFNQEGAYPTPLDWSRDDKWIAVVMSRSDRSVQIALVSPADGSLRPLRSVNFTRNYTQMFFSPDSRYLAFDVPGAQPNGGPDVHLLALDGSGETPVVVHPASDKVAGWTEDGSQLLFISDRSGSKSLWTQPIESGKPKGAPRLILPNFGSNHLAYLGPSRVGDLYYSALGGSTTVAVASFDPGSAKVSVTEQFTGGIQPDWSRDGKLLVYKGLVRGSLPWESLQIVALATGESRELQPKLPVYNWPRWSPDGRSLLVNATDEKGHQGIYRIDAQTSEVREIAVAGTGQLLSIPQWLPDGKKILYHKRSSAGGQKIAVIERDLGSGKERAVIEGADFSNDDASTLTMTPSPDGRFFAHVRFDQAAKRGSIDVVSLKDGKTRELVKFEGDRLVTLGGWTPDSQSLVYSLSTPRPWPADYTGVKNETWIVPANGGQSRLIDLGDRFARQVRVHPNGKQIAFWIANQTPEQVWVVENLHPKTGSDASQ